MNPALNTAMHTGPQLRLRIDFAPGCSVGPGKVGLLEAIERCGSLSEAARQLGMSYRRAWLLLDELNRSFHERLATTAVGGSHGGGAQLTPFGRDLIEAFRGVEREANTLARKRLSKLVLNSTGKAAGKAGAAKPRARSLVRRKRVS
jgi:molybdate transport system regulatory protein